MESELNDIMFNVLPVANRYMRDANNDIGIVRIMINVALQRPKKINTTNITNMNVMKMVSFRESMVLRMLSDVSTMIPNLTSEGSDS